MMKLVFGSYVQLFTNNAIINITKHQTIGAIILDSKGTNGTHDFLSLEIGKEVHDRIVREFPISNDVINRVNKLGS